MARSSTQGARASVAYACAPCLPAYTRLIHRTRGWEREQIAAAWGDTDAEGRVTLANLDPQRTYYVHLEAPDPDNVDFEPPRPRDLIGTWKPTSTEWTVRLPAKRK